MKKIFFIVLSALFVNSANAKIQVATTTPDLAALVREVAKDKVDVFSIGKGTQDPHQIEAKPSFMVKLRSTDVVIAQGLELESAWLSPLIQGARNPKLTKKEGVFELGAELDPIEISKGSITRADGDVHPGGNPHFQLDPIRLGQAGLLIATKLGELDPTQKDEFRKNAEAFKKKMEEKTKEWQARLKKTNIIELVAYHKNFSYFCFRFALQYHLLLEPKPGIPPTANHLLDVIEQMKKRNINLVLIENLYEDAVGAKLKTYLPNLRIERVPVSVEGEPAIVTNEQLIERLVKAVEAGAR